jgi:biotin/methionine sulfoxide reductase
MTEIKPHAAHWGFFDAITENGRLVGVRPFAQDPVPATLIESIPATVHSEARIDRPTSARAGSKASAAAICAAATPSCP